MKASPYLLFHYKHALEGLNSFEAKDLNFFRRLSRFPLLVFATIEFPIGTSAIYRPCSNILEVSP